MPAANSAAPTKHRMVYWHNGGLPETVVARAPRFSSLRSPNLHITSPGTLAYGLVDTVAALARSIGTLNRLSPRPDLVVIPGDIANSARCKHDRRIQMRKAFPDPAYTADGAINAMAASISSSSIQPCPAHRTARCGYRGMARRRAGHRAGAACALFLQSPGLQHRHCVRRCSPASLPPSARPANKRSLLSSSHAGRKSSRSSPKPPTCTRGSPARGSEAEVTHNVPIGEFPGPYS